MELLRKFKTYLWLTHISAIDVEYKVENKPSVSFDVAISSHIVNLAYLLFQSGFALTHNKEY